MTSQTGQEITTIYTFFKYHAENEARRLVPEHIASSVV